MAAAPCLVSCRRGRRAVPCPPRCQGRGKRRISPHHRQIHPRRRWTWTRQCRSRHAVLCPGLRAAGTRCRGWRPVPRPPRRRNTKAGPPRRAPTSKPPDRDAGAAVPCPDLRAAAPSPVLRADPRCIGRRTWCRSTAAAGLRGERADGRRRERAEASNDFEMQPQPDLFRIIIFILYRFCICT